LPVGQQNKIMAGLNLVHCATASTITGDIRLAVRQYNNVVAN